MKPELIALHKHWCTADAVKQFIAFNVPDKRSEEYPEWLIDLGNKESMFSRMSVWYALLYVVIEGFRELKLSHPEVNELLKNEECVDTLRLFRNAVFHYQKDPLTEKTQKFLEAEDSENWIRALNKALEKFFLGNLLIKRDIEQFKRNNA